MSSFILMTITILFVIGLFIYFIRSFFKFNLIKKLAIKNRLYPWLILIVIIGIFIWYLSYRFVSGMVIFLHLVVISLIVDLIIFIIEKIRGKFKYNYSGIISISLMIIILSVGYFYAHHIYQTSYTLESNKIKKDIRIVQITDSHLGITFDGNGFNKYLDKIEKLNPDVLVITGDFVDDETKKKELITVCNRLKTIKTKYGVYYIDGNHDKGYYNRRDFSKQYLDNTLKKSGVIILNDKSVLLDNNFYLIGRKDKEDSRLTSLELTNNLDKDKYKILLDHQPNSYQEELKSNVDLVISGHTHGGHMFPVNLLMKYFHINDQVYGIKRINNNNFIVSSGISGWAIPFKTCTKSEYVVIDIKKK